jgi:hypothetical protein
VLIDPGGVELLDVRVDRDGVAGEVAVDVVAEAGSSTLSFSSAMPRPIVIAPTSCERLKPGLRTRSTLCEPLSDLPADSQTRLLA